MSRRVAVVSAAGLVALGVLAVLAVTDVWALGAELPERSGSLVTAPVGILVCLVAARRHTGNTRRAWLLFAASLAVLLTGDVLWVGHATGRLDPSMVEVAEAAYLLALLPALGALVSYPLLVTRDLWRLLLIDVLVLLAAILLLCYLLILRHVLAPGLDATEVVAYSLFPVGGSLLAALLVLVLMRGEPPVRLDLLLSCGVQLSFFLAGTGFSLGNLPGGDPRWLVLSEAAYAVTPLLVAGVALSVAAVPMPQTRLRAHLPGVVAPLLPDLAALFALVLGALLMVPDTMTKVLAVITLGAIGVRQVFQRASAERLRGELEVVVAHRTRELAQLREDYRRLDAMKHEFVTAVSHELRTPLAAIRGSLEMLSDGDAGRLAGPALGMVDMAARGSERLTRLVDDIIDLERLESGTFGFDPGVHEVPVLVAEAVRSLESLAVDSGVRLRVESAPVWAWCDPDRVTQVVVNLVGNALKFSPRGGLVTVGARRGGDQVEVWVRDQGRGIPQDQWEAVFERFHQVEMDESRQRGGAGLGLTICRHIVHRHGGRIWVESGPGGSTFTFTLPAEQAGVAVA